MAFFHESIGFADPAAISAMPAEKLVDGMFYICRNTGGGIAGLYLYDPSDGGTIESPKKIAATNGIGRFRLFGAIDVDGNQTGVGLQAIIPTSPVGVVTPDAERSQILQRTTIAVEGMAKEILWVANGVTAADWIVGSASPVRTVSYGNPNGSIVADIAGQRLTNFVFSVYGNTATSYVSTTAGGTEWILI